MLQTKFPRLHERQEKIYIEDHRRVKKLAHHDQRAAQRRTFTADWARPGVYLKKWTTSGGLPSTAPAPIKLKLYQRCVVSINSCIWIWMLGNDWDLSQQIMIFPHHMSLANTLNILAQEDFQWGPIAALRQMSWKGHGFHYYKTPMEIYRACAMNN